MNNDDHRKHLELIQAVITRLAGNSFSIKAWTIALIGTLGALAAKDADTRLAIALIFPLLCFWCLDAYYLRHERLYRALYDKVVTSDPQVPVYSLDTRPFNQEVGGIAKVALSPTVCYLHVPVLIFALVLVAYSATKPVQGGSNVAPAPTSASGKP